MRHVATPFHISLKPGNTGGSIHVERVSASGVYRAAASVESWAEEAPFERVVFRDVSHRIRPLARCPTPRPEKFDPARRRRPPRARPGASTPATSSNLILDDVRLRAPPLPAPRCSWPSMSTTSTPRASTCPCQPAPSATSSSTMSSRFHPPRLASAQQRRFLTPTVRTSSWTGCTVRPHFSRLHLHCKPTPAPLIMPP